MKQLHELAGIPGSGSSSCGGWDNVLRLVDRLETANALLLHLFFIFSLVFGIIILPLPPHFHARQDLFLFHRAVVVNEPRKRCEKGVQVSNSDEFLSTKI